MQANNIYNSRININVASGVSESVVMSLPNIAREFKIKSILFDVSISRSVAIAPPLSFAEKISIDTDKTQIFNLAIGSNTGQPKLMRDLQKVSGAGTYFSGSQIILYKPQQIFFDNFFASNELPIVFSAWNSDLFTWSYEVCISIEIE